jgi:hypothetical protein
MDITSTFKEQLFRFNSGVTVDVTAEKVTAKASNGNNTIASENLDNFSYIENNKRRLSFFSLAGRTFLFGMITSIVLSFFVKDGWGALFFTASAKDIFFSWLSTIIFIVTLLLSAVIFWGPIVDAFFDFGIENMIMKRYTDFGYAVTIGNKSGNNILFWVFSDELPKIKKLENLISELKKAKPSTSISKPTIIVPEVEKSKIVDSKESMLDDLKKLGELFKDGILTKEEFEKKKAEILGAL